MMSSMFEIPILYVACDVKIVKKSVSFFCSRELRKIQLQTCFHVLAGFFFEKKLSWKRGGEPNGRGAEGSREEGSRERRIEQNRSYVFLFKNLINY